MNDTKSVICASNKVTITPKQTQKMMSAAL